MATKKASAGKAQRIPFHEWFALRQDEADVSNADLASILGYESRNVISMLRNGAMQLPRNKIGAAASALGIDKTFFLKKVLSERDPELLEVLDDILGNQMVTENEMKLLNFFRREMGEAELDIMKHPELIEAIRPVLADIAKREVALHTASVEAMKRNYKPGPAPRKAA